MNGYRNFKKCNKQKAKNFIIENGYYLTSAGVKVSADEKPIWIAITCHLAYMWSVCDAAAKMAYS